MSRKRIEQAVDRMRIARGLTESFLEDLPEEQWFWQPGPGQNHIAWHVGHLAFAQYFLCMKRVRGRTEADERLITTKFLKRYKQGSAPDPAPENNESIDGLRRVFDGVFTQSIEVLSGCTDEQLDVPSPPRHPVFETKLGAISWCGQHEMFHAGQIVLLRRMQGRPPRW